MFDTTTLRPLQQFSFLDMISQIMWSDDSTMILVGIHKRGVAYARNVYDQQWQCKIDEGMAGLEYCRWAPSSRHILTVSDFRLRMTMWSLTDRTVQYIPLPKYADKGLDFNFDGRHMALVMKPDEMATDPGQPLSDSISLFRTRSQGQWECLH